MKIFNARKIEINFRQTFSVKINDFIAGKNNGCTKIQDSAIGKRFYDNFDTDTIDIATRNSDYRLFIRGGVTQIFTVNIGVQVNKLWFARNIYSIQNRDIKHD